MKEHSILFKGDMVNAILEDRKTMTRRTKGLNKINLNPGEWKLDTLLPDGMAVFNRGNGHEIVKIKCPYGSPGDQLWVRETWTKIEGCQGPESMPSYRADGELSFEDGSPVKWKPSIFMPRWSSRITLEITNIRVERVQEITLEDIKKEGLKGDPIPGQLVSTNDGYQHYQEFKWLWDSIHGKGAWDRNDWIFVIEFKRIKP